MENTKTWEDLRNLGVDATDKAVKTITVTGVLDGETYSETIDSAGSFHVAVETEENIRTLGLSNMEFVANVVLNAFAKLPNGIKPLVMSRLTKMYEEGDE